MEAQRADKTNETTKEYGMKSLFFILYPLPLINTPISNHQSPVLCPISKERQ